MTLIASYKKRVSDRVPTVGDVILEVHQDEADGRCVLVQYLGNVGQYMTAPCRSGVECPNGGFWYGATPWKVHAHKVSRGYALAMFRRARALDLDVAEVLSGGAR